MTPTERARSSWSQPRRLAASITALVLLSLVTTAWTAFERGLFQDDAQVLFRVFAAPGGFFEALTMPLATPTRRLQSSPFALAMASGDPLLFLRLVGEAQTLGIGLIGMGLARRALRLGPRGSFVAGALIVTASSDWLTASLVALGYNLAILLHLAGALALVRWTQDGRALSLAAALALGTGSLWTVDAAATVHPLTPLLALPACNDSASRRRLAMGSVLWLACSVPYYLNLVAFLTDPASYAADAMVVARWPDRLRRSADLFVFNFTPWRWAFERFNWWPAPPSSIPLASRVALAAAGLAVTARVLARLQRDEPHLTARTDRPLRSHPAALLALLLGFTLLANATFMAVHFSEYHYRTQLLSRVWASLGLALVCSVPWSGRSAWSRAFATALVLTFVTLGMLGGLERQSYFTSYWRRHVTELGSIASALPALGSESRVLLRAPPHHFYMATEVPYLARAWVTLLSADASLECRTFHLAAGQGTTCEPGPRALVCRGELSPSCAGRDGWAVVLRYDRLVVMSYDPASNTYRIEPRLPADLVPAGADAKAALAAYAASTQVAPESVSWLARRLLDSPPR